MLYFRLEFIINQFQHFIHIIYDLLKLLTIGHFFHVYLQHLRNIAKGTTDPGVDCFDQ